MLNQGNTCENRIRVLIADGHPIFRQGIRGIFAEQLEIDLVAETDDGDDAVELVVAHSPDIALVDLAISKIGGIEVTRQIKTRAPATSVVILAMAEEEESLFQAIKVGASAFFLKGVDPADLIDGIRRVNAGECLINDSVLSRPLVASRVLKQFRDLSDCGSEIEPLFVPLSAREIEVLDYIARGNSNKEIARALKISDQTVKNHITSILRKLAVNDRTQAVVYALRRGWIKMQEL